MKKRVPMRTCVGCSSIKPKKELIRIVRKPTGEVQIDFKGKISGRGAYICPNIECLNAAIKNKRIEKSLEVKISDELYQKLKEELIKGEQNSEMS